MQRVNKTRAKFGKGISLTDKYYTSDIDCIIEYFKAIYYNFDCDGLKYYINDYIDGKAMFLLANQFPTK